MSIINLYETYKKVKQRVKRSSGHQLELAKSASAAAKHIVENPTIKNVEIFRKIENKWIKLSRKNSTAIANEFECAIISRNFEVKKPYNSYQTGWAPRSGFLYCFSSTDYPGIVKIGATERSIENRLKEYKSRTKLSHLKIVIAIKTNNPALKEKKIQDYLENYKTYPQTIKKSNEWFRITQKLAKEIISKYA
jgi:hypothetical protein